MIRKLLSHLYFILPIYTFNFVEPKKQIRLIRQQPHYNPIMSSGIQSLLKTEKEAAEIVNEARKYRTSRLKTAKQDAQQEIENYKKQKEEELQKFEKDHEGINEQINKEAEAEIEKELKTLKEQFEKKKSDVVKLLVEATISPNPQVHINANT